MVKKKAPRKTAKLPNFEEAIERLEQIIEAVEAGQVTLEQGLEQYEQGMKLIKHCQAILDRAEQKIQQLTLDSDAKVVADGDAGDA